MKHAPLWVAISELLRQRVSPDEFEVWLAPLRASLEGSALTLTAPSQVYIEYIRDHFLSTIDQLAAHAAARPITINLTALEVENHAAPSASPPRTPLHPRYTFSSFVPGPSNQFARAAAESVADNPGHAYNPLFIYGGSGLGKTHLLHAIGNQVLARDPAARVLYVPTEYFVNDLINSIRLQRMAAFRSTYRSDRVLLLDDVHTIAGKERTQEEFFHTFNTLHEAGNQIVLTSDTSPASIQGLEERLRSRFVWGLVADIQPPDLETKCAILREKAHSEGLELPDDVVLFIARRVRDNIRELEGLLNRIVIYCALTSQLPTLEIVRTALTSLLPEERTITPADIIRFTAHHYGIKVADLKGRDNRRSVAFPRQVAMYLIRTLLNLSYPEIGKLFSKHHSTVIYSVDAIASERRSNPSLDATLTTFAEHFH
jgi:chromosomal replication initiator protein